MSAFTFLDDEQTQQPGGSFTFLDNGAESDSSPASTVKNYGLGVIAGAGEGVANTEAAIGTFLQAPAANTLSGVVGARALADRGITAAINAVSPGSAKVNPEYQESAQRASQFAAETRAENAKSGIGARVAKALEDDGRYRAQSIQNFNRENNPELVRQQQATAEAEGFVDNLKAIKDNPLAFANTMARSAPDMAVGAGVARKAAQSVAVAGGSTAAQVGAASTAGMLSEAGSSAMQTREGVYQQVASIPLTKLLASPRYQEILAATKDPVQAREVLANELADQAPLLAGTGTALGTIITNRLFGGDTTAKVLSGAERTTAKDVAKNLAQESTEEGLQGVPEDLSQHGAVVQADPDKKFDVGGTLAQNMAAGAAMGGGGTLAAYGKQSYDDYKRGVPTDDQTGGNPSGTPPADTPTAADVLGVPESEQKQSAAEKALFEPKSLTALDRVQEIDTELQTAAPERSAELISEREAITKGWPATVEGGETTFSTEAGARVGAKYALIEAGDLVTSHDENLRPSPVYPSELQPRERDRHASEMQVSGIVQRLDPARLGLSADAATGAPIIGADGLVESGNARSIALKRIYQANGQKAEDYKTFIKANAAQFGVDPAAVDAMQKPVLVRVRTTPVNRAEFARQANASTVAQMSPSEQAKSDAARLDVLDDLHPTEDGDFSSSRDFIRRFMAKVPATEQAGMLDSSGQLSQTGYARIRNAVLAKAYGDSPVLVRMVESMDDNLRNIGKALMQAAPEVAKVRQDVADGALFDADITPDLMAAVEELSVLRDSGRSVQDALAQAGMFGDKYSPETRDLLQFLDENIRRPRQMAEFIRRYTEALRAAGNPNQGSLLGETAAPNKGDLLTAAKGDKDAAKDAERSNTGEGQGTRQQVAGEPANAQRGESRTQGHESQSEWVVYPPATGTLGIPRAEMPQVKGEARGALIQFLEARGITNKTVEDYPSDELKPTQAEFSTKKTEGWKGVKEGSDRSVLISSDGYILDGHHQWMAALAAGEPIKAIQFDAPIRELLAAVHQFPSTKRSAESASDAKRAQAREDFDTALAELGAFFRQLNPGVRMLTPEEKARLMPALVKLFEAGIKEIGYNIKDLIAHVKKTMRTRPELKEFWNRVDEATYREAAKNAVDNTINGLAEPAGQGELFSLPQRQAAQQDLFASLAPETPKVAMIDGRPYDIARDNFKPPATDTFIPPETLEKARDQISRLLKDSAPVQISEHDRARAEKTLQPIINKAEEYKAAFDQKVIDIAKRVGALGQMLTSVKSMGSATRKLVNEAQFDTGKMYDMLRATIVVSSYADAQSVLDEIRSRFEIVPGRIKNMTDATIDGKVGKFTPSGYGQVLINVKMPSDVIAEIQINVPEMLAVKLAEGHALYEIERAEQEGTQAKADAVALQNEIYPLAAAAAVARKDSSLDGFEPKDNGKSRAGVKYNNPVDSSSPNTLPSGNLTNSVASPFVPNLQPSGNLSGTFISGTSEQSIAKGQAFGYNDYVKRVRGNGNGNGNAKSGSGSAQSEESGIASKPAGQRKTQRVRDGNGGRDLFADRDAGAGNAPAEPVGQAAADGTGATSESRRRDGKRDRAVRNAGIPAGRDIPVKSGRNYAFSDTDLTYEGSWYTKARQNVEAVELLKTLESENRQATPEEQAVLAKFIGWGASEIANSIFGDKLDKQIKLIETYGRAVADLESKGRGYLKKGGQFRGDYADPGYYAAVEVLRAAGKIEGQYNYPQRVTREELESAKPDMGAKRWAELRDRLKAVMSDQEWKEASRSTQYAHYTSKAIVRAMWGAMERMGFKGGAILEPGAGIGVFPGLMPKAMANNSIYTGIEFDSLTGGVLKQLFPDERILVESFVDSKLPKNFYDVAAGNPPFNSTAILSDPEYKKSAFALHDYFFAKTIDRVKPGGLVMFVTSRYTLDKLNDKARAYMADRADLVGAIRLPQTAFKKNAGTEVVTDVLFLRKKVPGEAQFEHARAWGASVPITVNGQSYNINEYFVKHPEMVLGTHSNAGSMYGDKEYTVLPLAGDIEAQFTRAVEALPQDIYQAERGSAAEAVQVREIDFNPKAQKEGNYYVTDAGALMMREGGIGKRVELKNEKDVALIKDFVTLRDALKQAHYDQLNDGEWETSLTSLQKAYQAFVKKNGQINQFTEFRRTEKVVDEDSGETIEDERTYKRFPLLTKLQDDPDYSLVAALEVINDETGKISESPFLSERVLGKPEAQQIKTPADALLSVLNDLGHVDVGAIAERLNISPQEAIDLLGTMIYEDPAEGWVMADGYLSGNVKKKLRAAREAAKSDKRFERNIEALMAVQPVPVPPSDITVSLGMNWIPAESYEQFLQEKTGVKARVIYNERTGQWAVDAQSGETTTAATVDWGTQKRNAADILLAALTGAPIRITETVKEPGGGTKTVFLAEATEAANQKLAQMREAFREWIWQDAARTEKLVTLYNDTFNTIVPRKFDGRHLTLPGMSKRWTVFDHVKRGAWRIIQTGNTYLAHAVGSGKTFQMIISAMEQKRLGLIKKPMMVVPNHMLQQFAREWVDLYPAARLMVADEKNFHTENRRRFVSRVALSDLDGVVITHSAFKLLDLDPEFKREMIEQELDYLRAALEEAGGKEEVSSTGKKKKSRDPKIKQIESKIEKMEQKLEAAMSSAGKDKNVRFDELGVDMLYVDEAHEFRKLSFTTQRQVKGIDSSGSDRAFDLYMKTRWLERKNPGRSLVMASGTPVTNTLAELYSVQRFMAPDVLEERGLEEFDAWASMFGQEHTEIEADASGRYAPVTRFSKFVNVPELTQMFREFADVLTSDHLAALLGDKRPKVKDGTRKLVITPQTEQYASFKKELAKRLEISRAWKPSQDEPNNPDPVIRIIGDGRLAAIDMRFVEPALPSDPDSKLNKMIDEIIRVYQETSSLEYQDKAGQVEPNKGAAQIVFSDLGFGAGVAENRGFNARAWFEKRLREAGIPPAHVAFMSDHKKSIAKLKPYKDVNAGRVRVVVGSSKNMGTGVNAQQRLIALHHLDTPWYPADLEQREGRIIRQGNKNPVVQIYAFSTKGSYDAVMWQMLASKQRFIDQALSGDSSVRSIDDLSESSQFQIATAMTADDERAIQLAGLRAEIEKLQRLYRAHEEQRAKMRQDYEWAGRVVERGEKLLPELEKSAAKVHDLSGDHFKAKTGNVTLTERKAWGEAVLSSFKERSDKMKFGTEKVGEISGFDVLFQGYKNGEGGSYFARLMVKLPEAIADAGMGPNATLSESAAADPVGVALRAANIVAGLERLPGQTRQKIAEAMDKRNALEPRLNSPFQFSEMLADKIKEAQDLETAMLADQNKKTGLEREIELEEAWAAKTGAITPLFSRGIGEGGISLRDLKAVRDRVAERMTNLPPVNVLEEPGQAPKVLRDYIEKEGAWNNVEGAMHDGEIYLFASGIKNEERAEFILATHEITHHGLRGKYGMALDTVLQHIWMSNKEVRRAATALREKHGYSSNLEAVEEVLADMPTESLAKLKGWKRLAQAIRDWFSNHGFDRLAEKLDSWINSGMDERQKADLFVADVVRQARGWVENGRRQSGKYGSGTRLSRSGKDTSLSAEERADKIIAHPAATARPIDAVVKVLTKSVRVDRMTLWAYHKAGALMDRLVPEHIKAGVVSDYGVPEAVIDRRVLMQGSMRRQVRGAGELIDKLATLTREESRVAYEWMNNTDPQAAEYFEKQLPPDSLKVMAEVKTLIDQLSQEAVKLGQLDPESFKRNRFEYLRRSYFKHTAELTKSEAEKRGRAISILGDQYKGRGMVDSVAMSKFRNVAPEWWGRKLQEGKADKGLKGEKFARLERRAPVGEGTLPLEQKHGPGRVDPLKKGRLLEVVYWPVNEPIPAKMTTWEHAGTWEVRDTKGGDLVLWRDFTKQEREAMGEIDEARFAIAKTLHGMVHDVETGKYLEWLAVNYAQKDASQVSGTLVEATDRMRDTYGKDEWVQVPETTIHGTSVKKYGVLAGRYLPAPIWNDVRQTVGFRFEPLGETYAAILGAWKVSKTALSPAVHTNNVMANMVMADWHDVTAGHIVKALRLLLAANDRQGEGVIGRAGNLSARAGIADREAARVILDRVAESGGNIGTWATAELQKEQLEPLLKSLENEIAIVGSNQPAQVGAMVALQKALQLRFPSAWEAFKGTKAGKALTTEARNMLDLYEAEDQVFRLAAWLRAKEEGASDMEAGKLARKSFLDYNINAPWIQAMRKTAFPFISFTYRAIPMLLETAATKPWKLLKLGMLAGGLNMLGYLLSGGDEDDERRYLPEEKSGRVLGVVPKLIRMPWNDAHGSPVFLDIRRFVPVGDFLDAGQAHSAIPLIPSIVPGGVLSIMGELVLNKSQFTGKEITRDTDTATEKTIKVVDHLYKAFAPNLIVLPGTYAFKNVVDAGRGKTDTFGREQSTPAAVASSFGIKLGSYPTDVLRQNAWRETQAKTMEIDRNITQLKRELQRNGIDQDEFREKVDAQMDKKRALMQKFRDR